MEKLKAKDLSVVLSIVPTLVEPRNRTTTVPDRKSSHVSACFK